MTNSAELVARIVTERGPKRVLIIGDTGPEVATALRIAGAEIVRVDPVGLSSGEQYDLVLWHRNATAIPAPDARRRLIASVCTMADHVVVEGDPGTPAAYWSEGFAEHRFFVDVDVARAGVLSFQRAHQSSERSDDSGRLRDLADELYRALDEKDRVIGALRVRLAAIQATVGFKVLDRLAPVHERLVRHAVTREPFMLARRVLEVLVEEGAIEAVRKMRHKASLALHGRAFRLRPHFLPPPDVDVQYQLWLAQDPASDADRRRMAAAAASFQRQPTISVVTTVERGDTSALRRVLATLGAQIYDRWQLCVAAPRGAGATPSDPRMVIAEPRAGELPAAAALRLAHGEFIAFLDARDSLAPEALFELVKSLNDNPDADIVYSDEDAVDAEGKRVRPFLKPDWSPDLLLSTNYMARLALVRRSVLDELGGIRADAVGAETYDLLLRAVERTTRIVHVPRVLYHRRLEVPSIATAAAAEKRAAAERLVLSDALRRRGAEPDIRLLPGDAHALPHYAVRYRLRGQPLVSIVIATRDKAHLLSQCIRSIEEKSRYPRYEIIVVDNGSREPETLQYLAEVGKKHRVCAYPGKFNFSAINNLGASQASGEQLLFLNNDVEVIAPDWLEAMLEHAQRADVGAVGAKLLYPDGRIQHAGVVVGLNAAAGNVFRLAPAQDERGPRLCDVVRDCSAVTAACLMVPRRIFEDLRGFDERLPIAFQDVDLCLRIRDSGRLVVYTPFALLYHYEGASRGRRHPSADERLFQRQWAALLERGDPYYNPNLTHVREDWSLRLER
jgi:GT2 family glycosyltransferase